MNGTIIKLFKKIITLPHIIEILPKCLIKSKGNPLNFMRCIEIESLKLMLNCGDPDSNECKEKVTKVYVNIIKYMMFRDIPKDDVKEFLVDINKMVLEYLTWMP